MPSAHGPYGWEASVSSAPPSPRASLGSAFPPATIKNEELAKFRRRKLGFVFQDFRLLDHLTTFENVALPLYYQKVPRKERQEKALKYLERVGLKPWASHLPSELSGGQKQRVAIARAMIEQGEALAVMGNHEFNAIAWTIPDTERPGHFLREPTGALDSTTSYEVMDLIQKINDEGNTILVVTHEEDIAHMCKRIVHLKDGIIVEDKKIEQVRADQYV